MTELQKSSAPSEEQVFSLLKNYLPPVKSVQRTPEGVSTYVYKVEAGSRICYARFLPENATFGVEALAHRLLLQSGVPVPEILCYLPREPVTGLSMMVVSALPGQSLHKTWAGGSSLPILRQAGTALARLHALPVAGFGWVDRNCETELKGEFPTFSQYFTEFWEQDLAALERCGFSASQRNKVRSLLEKALRLLETDRASLVHGDFCMEHIFQEGGEFTGFIDFGEIRGNHPFFDLGTFALNDPTPNRTATAALLEGYGQIRPLGPEDLFAVELSAMAFALRFTGRKAGSASEGRWKGKLLEELDRL